MRKTASFFEISLLVFYVCPEPVLAKRSFLCINGSKMPFFAGEMPLIEITKRKTPFCAAPSCSEIKARPFAKTGPGQSQDKIRERSKPKGGFFSLSYYTRQHTRTFAADENPGQNARIGAEGKPLFLVRSFYQDRLGTNIGKVEQEKESGVFCRGEHAP